MLCDPAFWATVLISILVAVAVPLGVERIRRPILEVGRGDQVADDRFRIAHVQARNLPMRDRGRVARFLGQWLTAFAADGCMLEVVIQRSSSDPHPITFSGKWSSRVEPVTTHRIASGHRIDEYDPQKLPGIHELTLQPGPTEQAAVAIRRRGRPNAYAYEATKVYAAPPPAEFPEHPDVALPPGSYGVKVRASAGEVRSPWVSFVLDVGELPSDVLTLTDAP